MKHENASPFRTAASFSPRTVTCKASLGTSSLSLLSKTSCSLEGESVPSKPEFSRSDNDENTSEGVLDAVHQLVYLDPRNSDTGITIDPSNKDPKLDTGFSQSLKYDCTSPEDNGIPHNDIETETVLEMALAGLELKQTTLRNNELIFGFGSNYPQPNEDAVTCVEWGTSSGSCSFVSSWKDQTCFKNNTNWVYCLHKTLAGKKVLKVVLLLHLIKNKYGALKIMGMSFLLA